MFSLCEHKHGQNEQQISLEISQTAENGGILKISVTFCKLFYYMKRKVRRLLIIYLCKEDCGMNAYFSFVLKSYGRTYPLLLLF
jgi:hypothetical protein